jgi:hypothetical protein
MMFIWFMVLKSVEYLPLWSWVAYSSTCIAAAAAITHTATAADLLPLPLFQLLLPLLPQLLLSYYCYYRFCYWSITTTTAADLLPLPLLPQLLLIYYYCYYRFCYWSIITTTTAADLLPLPLFQLLLIYYYQCHYYRCCYWSITTATTTAAAITDTTRKPYSVASVFRPNYADRASAACRRS